MAWQSKIKAQSNYMPFIKLGLWYLIKKKKKNWDYDAGRKFWLALIADLMQNISSLSLSLKSYLILVLFYF
jgi:hypothetical protein